MTTKLVTVICKAAYTDGITKQTHTTRDKPYSVTQQRFELLAKKGLVEEVKAEVKAETTTKATATKAAKAAK